MANSAWSFQFDGQRRARLAARAAFEGRDAPLPQPRRAIRWPASPPLRFVGHSVLVGLALIACLFGQRQMWLPAVPPVQPALPAFVASSPDQVLIRHTDALFAAPAPLSLLPPGSRNLPAVYAEQHIVAEGESLGDLAARYGVSVESLFWANDLAHAEVLAAGRELRVPRVSGLPHIVAEGDTLAALADQFAVVPDAIVLFPTNRLRPGEPLPVGRELFIPGATTSYPAAALARFGGVEGIRALRAVAVAVVREPETNLRSGPGRVYPRAGLLGAGQPLTLLARHAEWVQVAAGATAGWVRSDLLLLPAGSFERLAETNDFPPPPPIWVWPTRGTLTSPFGWRYEPFRSFHNGIDIANASGTPIRAARAGTVAEAGWCRGYGYCVRINHGEGISTIYGHLVGKPLVRAGEQVAAGDQIGGMGMTYDAAGGGYASGVHLHFTVTVNGSAVDPLRFLP